MRGNVVFQVFGGTLALVTLGTPLASRTSFCAADSTLPRDTLTVTLGFRIPADFGIPLNVHREYLLFAQDIAAKFRPPDIWRFPIWPGTYLRESTKWEEPIAPALGVEGLLVVRVSKDGRVQRAVFTAGAGAPTLEPALLAAVHLADSAGLFAPTADLRQRQDTTVVLQVVAGQLGELGFIPLARFRLAAVQVDEFPTIRKIPPPDHPGGRGSVILQYVIGSNGRAEPGSFTYLYADAPEFARAAVAAISRGRFTPARKAGCPVRMLVTQRVSFM